MLTVFSIHVIEFYQRRISPFKPRSCRFYPSCSEYAKLSFLKKGFLKGFYFSLLRFGKCHPFHPGGHDPVT